MACLNRHWMDVRTLWNVRALVALAGTLCAASCASHGAPLTFRFDAEIVNVPAGNPFDLPLTLKVGDVIHGKFTFEPGSGMPIGNGVIAANQSFALQFDINGTVVGTSGYSIEVFDDTAFDDSEFPEPIDVMTLGCNEPSCIPDLISLADGEPFRVRSRMQFVGISSILLAPEIMADPAIWNAFVFERRLNLNFDNDGPGAMGFQAAVGNFSLVPEPESLGLAVTGLLLSALICLVGWFRRWWRHHRTSRTGEGSQMSA